MHHIVWLGVRGVLLEVSAAVLRMYGAFHYRRLLRHQQGRRVAALSKLNGVKAGS